MNGKKFEHNRVVRGGSWDFNGGLVRSAVRDWRHPVRRDGDLGFRCAGVPVSPEG
jgi:formylglycine-generating enzyme required for sulfatase activity